MRIYAYCLLMLPFFGWGQLTLNVNLESGNQLVGLNTPVQTGDYSFQLEQFRFYLSKFEFYQNGQLKAVDPVHAYLVDFEVDSTRKLIFPDIQPSEIDEIRFLFGIDSLINTSGAMEGALDPMHGMYWSWQSGYINCKLEGIFLTPKREVFQLHLGGYAHPFMGAQHVVLETDHKGIVILNIDLDALLEQVSKPNSELQVMSPGIKAVEYAQLLVKSIRQKP